MIYTGSKGRAEALSAAFAAPPAVDALVGVHYRQDTRFVKGNAKVHTISRRIAKNACIFPGFLLQSSCCPRADRLGALAQLVVHGIPTVTRKSPKDF